MFNIPFTLARVPQLKVGEIPYYPKTLPCGQIEGFTGVAGAGLIRTEFDAGNVRQRRVHRQMPHIFQISWIFRQVDVAGRWFDWANAFGYSWFRMPMPSWLAGALRYKLGYHVVRLISDIQQELINSKDGFYWKFSAEIEWYPAGEVFEPAGGPQEPPDIVEPIIPPPNPDDNTYWISANVLADPSPDIYDSGTPAALATTSVTSGTPAKPNAPLI